MRLSLIVAFVAIVISSPIVIFANPAVRAAANGNNVDTSGQHSGFSLEGRSAATPAAMSATNASPLDSGYTTQAALSGVSARQTNNIVGAFSYYDVLFTTSTGGTIKFIDITFHAATAIGTAPLLVESEGIGAGTAAKISATQIRYTVTNAVAIPAGTQIRLEFFNLVNPTVPGFYKVTVTTRNAAGTAIDGPTLSNSLNIKQIGTEQIADGAITPEAIEREGGVNPAFALVATGGFADCLPGEEAVGGGFRLLGQAQELKVISEEKLGGSEAWEVVVFNSDNEDHSFQVIVICMPAMP